VNLDERRPALKVRADQFPYSEDPIKAALDYALRHQVEFDPSLPADERERSEGARA
jgi:hypothetical protein